MSMCRCRPNYQYRTASSSSDTPNIGTLGDPFGTVFSETIDTDDLSVSNDVLTDIHFTADKTVDFNRTDTTTTVGSLAAVKNPEGYIVVKVNGNLRKIAY